MKVSKLVKRSFLLVVFLSIIVNVSFANEITVVPASSWTPPILHKPGYPDHVGEYAPYDTSGNLAYQGNGFAKPSVAKDSYEIYPPCHQEEFANDGYYGNGASWISNSPNSWLKIDLGQTVWIDRVKIGRDRVNNLIDDRDPGQFTIAVALYENAYANGDDSDDQNEYTQVFDSTVAGFSGIINGDETLQASFTPVLARFIKLQVANGVPPTYGACIDEVEVFGIGLVAYWKFDGDATDSSGFSNDGTENGGVSYVDGVCGQAITLDGVDDYVDMGTPSELRITGALTVSAWFWGESEQPVNHPMVVSRWGRDVLNQYCWQLCLYDVGASFTDFYPQGGFQNLEALVQAYMQGVQVS